MGCQRTPKRTLTYMNHVGSRICRNQMVLFSRRFVLLPASLISRCLRIPPELRGRKFPDYLHRPFNKLVSFVVCQRFPDLLEYVSQLRNTYLPDGIVIKHAKAFNQPFFLHWVSEVWGLADVQECMNVEFPCILRVKLFD